MYMKKINVTIYILRKYMLNFIRKEAENSFKKYKNILQDIVS